MAYTFFAEFFIPVNNGTEISDDDEKFHITLFQEMVDIIKM